MRLRRVSPAPEPRPRIPGPQYHDGMKGKWVLFGIAAIMLGIGASARLEVSRAEAEAQRSQAALDRSEKIYLRQRTLVAAGATPRLTFEKAEHEYQSAQQEFTVMDAAARSGREHVQAALKQVEAAKRIVEDKAGQLEEAQADLQAAEVHSPVDGYV